MALLLRLDDEGVCQFDKVSRAQIRRYQRRYRFHPQLDTWFQYRTRKHPTWRTIPPLEYRMGLVRVYHDSLGHAGVAPTNAALRQHFTWLGMEADVYAFVKGCDACQRHATLPVRLEPPHLYDLLGPYQHVCMDYCGPFPYMTAEGKEEKGWVAVMVDYFTKIAEFVVVYDKTAPTAARAIYDHWLTRYPKPAKWTTDHGTEFGDAVTHLLKKFGILHVKCAVQNPKGNGAAERLVQSLKKMLRAWVNQHTQHWVQLLPHARGAYMRRVHATTGVAPMHFLYACQPELLLPLGDVLQPDESVARVGVTAVAAASARAHRYKLDAIEEFATCMSEAEISVKGFIDVYDSIREQLYRSAYHNIADAQQRHRLRYIELAIQKAGRHVYDVQPGDYVLVLLENQKGLRPQFAGPFKVHWVTEMGNVVVGTAIAGTLRSEEQLWSVNPRRVVPYHASPVPPVIDWLPDA
jgi:transposase InsO family protein